MRWPKDLAADGNAATFMDGRQLAVVTDLGGHVYVGPMGSGAPQALVTPPVDLGGNDFGCTLSPVGGCVDGPTNDYNSVLHLLDVTLPIA